MQKHSKGGSFADTRCAHVYKQLQHVEAVLNNSIARPQHTGDFDEEVHENYDIDSEFEIASLARYPNDLPQIPEERVSASSLGLSASIQSGSQISWITSSAHSVYSASQVSAEKCMTDAQTQTESVATVDHEVQTWGISKPPVIEPDKNITLDHQQRISLH